MDIKAIAANALNAAFKATGAVLVDVTLRLSSRVVPTVTNDDPDESSAVHYAIKALKYQTREQKLGDDASKTSTFLLKMDDLVALGFTGEVRDGDEVREGTMAWVVYRADPDPAGVCWILQTRR